MNLGVAAAATLRAASSRGPLSALVEHNLTSREMHVRSTIDGFEAVMWPVVGRIHECASACLRL